MQMKLKILRRGLVCIALGLLAGMVFWGLRTNVTTQGAVLAGILFALASFVAMNVLPYVASNFFGKKKPFLGSVRAEAKVVYSATRRSERKPVRLPVILLIEGEEVDPHALAVEMSQHGVRLQTKAAVKPRQSAQVIFEGDPNHAVQSRVVWVGRVNTDRQAETGLEFINPIPATP